MKLEVRKAETRDLPAIKRLTDEYLAQDYYSMETLETCIQGDRNLFYVVTDAERNSEVVSYFYAFLAGLDEALEILHVKKKPEPLLKYDGEALMGVYKLSSTEKAYQRHGICSSFVRNLEPVLRERGAKLILATAMRSPEQKVPMKKIFHDTGFSAIAEIHRPWEELTLYCPYCNRTHCICDAVFYVKKLEDEDVNE